MVTVDDRLIVIAFWACVLGVFGLFMVGVNQGTKESRDAWNQSQTTTEVCTEADVNSPEDLSGSD